MMIPDTHKPAQKSFTQWNALSMAFEVGYIIAIPAVLFGFGGAHLDKAQDTFPIFTMVGLLAAFGISAFAVIHRVKSLL